VRTADCVVIGIAGDPTVPALVPGLRHGDGETHHFGVTRPTNAAAAAVLQHLLASGGPDEHPIRSRWQHDAVPAWRRLPPELVCEVAYTTLDDDGGRWLRQPAQFVRCRFDRSPEDCCLDQLESAPTVVGEPA
jgi:ATP-dependent DNA ligase